MNVTCTCQNSWVFQQPSHDYKCVINNHINVHIVKNDHDIINEDHDDHIKIHEC